jgi:type IV pilus assembly protein PilY1
VAIFGEREGGTHYSALDITDPTTPGYLFSLSDSSMGYTWSDPRVYKLKTGVGDEVRDRFFAFMGGGYWPDTMWDFNDPIATGVKGNCIYAVNIWGAASGEDVVPDYHVITYNGSNGSGDLEYMQYPIPSGAALSKTGETRATFLGRYEYWYKDLLWIGDMKGQLWRVDMRDPDPVNWDVTRLFVANTDVPYVHRPIFQAPATTMDENGQRWVYFGTGNRANPCDDTEDNCFVAVKDYDYGGYLTTADLKKLSPDGTYDPAEPYSGWYVEFADYGHGIGEKVYSSPVIVADTLYFTTFQANEAVADPCALGSGIARLYKFHYITGGYHGDVPFEEIGEGVPQTPVVSTDMMGNTVLVISTGEGGITTIVGAPGEGRPKRTIWWRDIKGGPSRF